jgi:uncharacterized phage protein (TIGR02218 family)
MTSFDALESGLETSRPLEIYAFTLDTTVYRYTSDPTSVTFGGQTYDPVALKRDTIMIGQQERKRIMSITLPLSNSFVQKYIGVPPAQRAQLVISRLQRDASPMTKIDIYVGSVQEVEFPDVGVAKINVQSIESVGSRNIPRYTYMGMCNHTLYDANCGVNPLSHRFTSTITAIASNVITVSGLSGSGLDCTGGYIKLVGQSEYRVVLAQATNNLTLLVPLPASANVGTQVECYRGCDHLVGSDCAGSFNNVLRFGGFPFVPTRNIFTQGLNRG